MVTLQLNQLSVPPGPRLLLRDISWQAFEDVLADRQWVRQPRGE